MVTIAEETWSGVILRGLREKWFILGLLTGLLNKTTTPVCQDADSFVDLREIR